MKSIGNAISGCLKQVRESGMTVAELRQQGLPSQNLSSTDKQLHEMSQQNKLLAHDKWLLGQIHLIITQTNRSNKLIGK
jgi:hypothetical protein